jgi:hypothetical protein
MSQKQYLLSNPVGGLPEVLFSDKKNPNSGKFWRAFEWKLLVNFMVIWNILGPFCTVVAICS